MLHNDAGNYLIKLWLTFRSRTMCLYLILLLYCQIKYCLNQQKVTVFPLIKSGRNLPSVSRLLRPLTQPDQDPGYKTCFMLDFRCLNPFPRHITKTYLYNVDPLKPYFYIVKLGFSRGIYIYIYIYIYISCFCLKT